MCGILFCCSIGDTDTSHQQDDGVPNIDNENLKTETTNIKILLTLLEDSTLTQRGPDVSKQHRLPLSSERVNAWMRGCVLHLRGQMTPQPLADDKGNALLWNGEIFDGIKVSREQNDTQVLFQRLTNCRSDEDILITLEEVQGPWAVIFWQAEKNKLWFGRDVYGRRSLLWHLPADPSDVLVLTSVNVGNLGYTEIPSVGVFTLDLSSVNSFSSTSDQPSQPRPLPSITLHPWYQCRWPGTTISVRETQQEELSSFLFPNNQHPSVLSITVDSRQILKYWIPTMSKSLSSCNKVDGVVNDDDDDKLLRGSAERVSGDESDLVDLLDKIRIENEHLRSLSEELVGVLQKAVMKRINCFPLEEHSTRPPDDPNVTEAKIAVLFSGGLDSSVLAALLDRCLPPDEPIDLLNVAFQQPTPTPNTTKVKHKRNKTRNKNKFQEKADDDDHVSNSSQTLEHIPESGNRIQSCHENLQAAASNNYVGDETLHASTSTSTSLCEENFNSNCNLGNASTSSPHSTKNIDFDPYNVPDRRTGRLAFSELNPNRRWNFIEVNVSQDELQVLRSTRIGKLIYPLQTVLDDSIGCAVWFAARGRGKLVSSEEQRDVISRAKVILCGMAADEQFAGYSRHRAHFHQLGEESLVNQLEMEMWRISARNLGRDDRIIADHGKEARFPFLDEEFTEFVSQIPVYLRANLYLPRGIGEKLLLRLSALSLGLRHTACQPKRAIQFGSKIAKLDDTKEKGSDICQRLL